MKIFTDNLSIVLFAGLFAASAPQVAGSPSHMVSAPGSQSTADTVRIDTIRSEAIYDNEGVAFYNDQVIIMSNSKFQQVMIPGHISFGEDATYLADPEALDRTPKKLLATKEPFAYPPAGIAISTGANVLYYTAPENGSRGKDKIFAVPIEKGPARTTVALAPVYTDMLPFCEGSDAYRHPAVPVNNEFMVFASDREGAMGGFDLFLVQKKAEGWGQPVHMGNEINSVKDELYPFIDDEKNLYFSSARNSGFGGLDIYMCKFDGDGWERSINLTNVINSPGDDFGLKIDAKNNTGFFNSLGSKGNESGQLFKLQPNQQGHLSEELLAMALTEFEEIFGVAFTSSSEQKMMIPQAIEMREVQAEKIKPKKEEDKAEKKVNEVVQTDPSPQDFTAARKDPARPVKRKKRKATDEILAAANPEKTTVVKPTETTVTTVTTVTTETSQTTETTKTEGMRTNQAQAAEAAEKDVNQEKAQEGEKDVMIFRVQITATRSSAAGKKVNVDGQTYTVFEYRYKGAYRQTVGAFNDLDDATAFQTKCRKAGFSQAFVAAFINDKRVTDRSVFIK